MKGSITSWTNLPLICAEPVDQVLFRKILRLKSLQFFKHGVRTTFGDSLTQLLLPEKLQLTITFTGRPKHFVRHRHNQISGTGSGKDDDLSRLQSFIKTEMNSATFSSLVRLQHPGFSRFL